MPKKPPWLDPAEPKQNFALEMRKLRKNGGNPSQQRLAREMACSYSTVSAYLNARRRPQVQQLRSFVTACKGTTADWDRLKVLLEQLDHPPASEASRLAPALVPAPDPSAQTMLHTFQNVARALRDCLVRDSDGRPVGWRGDLRASPVEDTDGKRAERTDESGEPLDKATATSTAYGVRAMLLLEDGLAADLIPVAESLRRMAVPAGGYAGHAQSKPRPEATAAVLNALRRIDATDGFDDHRAEMERDFGDFEKFRPFILTMMLETSLLLKSGTTLVDTLVESLLDTRRPHGDLLLWPEKAEHSPVVPQPSVAHTARAVRVLASVQAIRPSAKVQRAIQQAVAWLVEQPDLHNAYEVTERMVDGKPESVHVRHFTAAWVVKALVSAGVPAAHPAVSGAVARIWDSYGGGTVALWAWDNGDLPIWMTFDAIEALRLANLALPAQPAWSAPI
jgi:transcriptional regulator with XRE-family HTH domain